MAPRKSDLAKPLTGDEGTTSGGGKDKDKDKDAKEGVNIEDLNLPKSIVTRLAKGVLPPNTQIQSNAVLALSKSATVFVNFLAEGANERAQDQGRKTIAPGDVFRYLEELGFGEFKGRLEGELQRFNEVQTDKRNTYRRKVAADKAAAGGGAVMANGRSGADNDNDNEDSLLAGGEDGQPRAKKARMSVRGVEAERQEVEVEVDNDETEEEEEEQGGGGGGDEDGEGEDEQEGDVDQDEGVEDRDMTEGEEDHDGNEDEALDNGEDSD